MSYDKKYDNEEYYWGKEPSRSAVRFLSYVSADQTPDKSLLDIGCGEGRNTIHFAKHSFNVTGLDLSKNGLKKTEELANQNNVVIKTEIGNVNNLKLTSQYSVIFSAGTIHYLSPESRDTFFKKIQNHTLENGFNCLNVFVQKPFIEKAPDAEENVHFFQSGQLLRYYAEWEILFANESIFDCNSGGVPHKHCINSIIAKKIIL